MTKEKREDKEMMFDWLRSFGAKDAKTGEIYRCVDRVGYSVLKKLILQWREEITKGKQNV